MTCRKWKRSGLGEPTDLSFNSKIAILLLLLTYQGSLRVVVRINVTVKIIEGGACLVPGPYF